MKVASLLGRLVFGGFFLYNGINHLRQRKALAQYAAAKNVVNPELAVVGSGILLALAGTSLTLGIKPRVGALLAAIFLSSVSPVMHDFWNIEEPGQRQNDMINFSKNMALLGAAFTFDESRGALACKSGPLIRQPYCYLVRLE